MAQTSFAVMTTLGRAKEAAALANATTITVTEIAIGDGATVPSGGETALYHEVARKTISGHGTVVGAANVAYFDCYLAAADGPYTIREAGLYDDEGDLIAIAHYDPPINKPVPASGQTVEGTVRLEVAFSDVANVVIVVDPSMQVALQRLTRLPWIPIISMSLTAPPASPVAGDTYLIVAASTGAWAGQAGKIAEYTTAGWAIITPPDGHGVSLPDGRVFERIAGAYVEKIALDVQSGKWGYGADAGTANALVMTLQPVPAAYTTGMKLLVKKSANANTTTTPTINVNGLGAKTIVRRDGDALSVGDLPANSLLALGYDSVNMRVLSLVASDIASGASIPGRTQIFTASGTFTVPAGVTQVEVEVFGAGGGGGASSTGTGGATTAGNAGGGGHGGGWSYKRVTGLVPGAAITVTIGAGGVGQASNYGTAGSSSSFGAYCSASGGGRGGYGGNVNIILDSPGMGSGGDINIQGGYGGPSGDSSTTYNPSNALQVFSRGGIGAGGLGGLHFRGTGQTGIGIASGGGGASGGTGVAGGDGAPGLVIVRW